MTTEIDIQGRTIGPGRPTYVIAELSANHLQSFERAVKLIQAAKEAGADAVKLQTYTPDSLTISCDNPYFRIQEGTLWAGRTLYDLYSEAATPYEWHAELKRVADELGITLFSTAFDAAAVDFLEKLGMPVHKIASFELVDLPLIRKAAQTGKPLILSTGMATLAEIEEAVNAAREAGAKKLALLKTNSGYPAPPEEMNLRTIPHLREAFGLPVGLSDHTLSVHVPAVAVTLGASIIEKHLTLSRSEPGPDSAFSLEPHEFKAMVEGIRMAEKAMGRVSYGPTLREQPSRMLRRSLFVVQDMKAGEIFTEDNVRSIRPAHGLHPRHLYDVLGRKA
ncbi:MAG: pseudaminic acid synthase, partial [Alicyclobacillaceae bacterium]|nr:pseudaminic acid synthase [Alicyclobacillaceae bacterium]